MQITSVKIILFDTGSQYGKIRAYAEVEFNHSLLIRGLKVMETAAGGLYVSYPSVRSSSGSFIDLLVPVTKVLATQIRDQVVAAYREAIPQQEFGAESTI